MVDLLLVGGVVGAVWDVLKGNGMDKKVGKTKV